jgi:hypothetical protein
MTQERLGTVLAGLAAGLVGGLAASLLTSGVQAQADVVTARQLNLVDDTGRLRGVLSGRDERGLASVAFYDPQGQVRGVLGAQEDGTPVLWLLDAGGQRRLVAEVQGDDALLIVGEPDGRNGMLASLGGNPVFSLSDAGRSRLQMQLAGDGAPSLALSTSQGQRGAGMVVDSSDAPVVTLYEGGTPRVALAVIQQAAVLNFSDPASQRLVVGVASNGRPSISFLNEKGEVAQELPEP